MLHFHRPFSKNQYDPAPFTLGESERRSICHEKVFATRDYGLFRPVSLSRLEVPNQFIFSSIPICAPYRGGTEATLL